MISEARADQGLLSTTVTGRRVSIMHTLSQRIATGGQIRKRWICLLVTSLMSAMAVA